MVKIIFFVLVLLSVFSCKPPVIAGSKINQTIVPQCLPSQSQCLVETSLGTFNVNFSINPDHNKVITEVPFHIVVEFAAPTNTSLNINSIEGYLEGRDMFMGKIPAFFSQLSSNNTSINNTSINIAEILLGSCSEDIMTWRLWLTIELGDKDQPNIKQTKSFFIDFDSHRYL